MEEPYLVPHHRKNRGAGGSKVLENDITNLILICAGWNGSIESDATNATVARNFGQKLRSWQSTSEPVYDLTNGLWYCLTSDGQKVEVDTHNTF